MEEMYQCASFGEFMAPMFDMCSRREDAEALIIMTHVLKKSRERQPVFSEGPYQALGRISDALAGLSQVVTHNESAERIQAHAFDLLTIVWRFACGEYVQKEEERGEAAR